MAAYWIWWLLAAVLVGAELLTGTYYLLAVGFSLAVGGAVAWLGGSVPMQLVVAGVVGVGATIVAHRWRLRRTPPPAVPLDVGQSVRVQAWNEDGTARVDYRGTQWDAELAVAGAPRAETMYIVGTRGSTLLIAARRI